MCDHIKYKFSPNTKAFVLQQNFDQDFLRPNIIIPSPRHSKLYKSLETGNSEISHSDILLFIIML